MSIVFKKPSEWITADDFLNQLENDPVWIADELKRDREHEALIEKDKRGSAPLLADLAKNWFSSRSSRNTPR